MKNMIQLIEYQEKKVLIKLKCLPENLIIDKHIENFDELKINSESYIKKTVQEQSVQKSKYDDIISNLKDLGILSYNTNKQ